ARFAPVLESLIPFIDKGGKVLGICNGFQILTELGVLPGALTRNNKLHFICESSSLSISSSRSDWFKDFRLGDIISLPIAHGEGRYQCSPDTLKKLEDEDCIAIRYQSNPNGSVSNIAGITNRKGNVLGMMPHPERATCEITKLSDGENLFKSISEFLL
ncbi:MAG: phosphoribosylformylglycinamidine synthase I, partial [Pseudomonadota bacterium]|nr:phosphoribosylformylglycinamidine synthase I [Pseudomonadota bacterium]